MSNQSDEGWYPECEGCGCGNLGSGVFCSECHQKEILKVREEERKKTAELIFKEIDGLNMVGVEFGLNGNEYKKLKKRFGGK